MIRASVAINATRCLQQFLLTCALLGSALIPHSTVAQSIDGLESSKPAPELADKMNLFGQFVGDWRFDYVGYKKDGTSFKAKGEWHFGWILEGRAVQDVWIIPGRPERNNPGTPKGEYGTTVRFYDPKLDALARGLGGAGSRGTGHIPRSQNRR